jgi:hypothetical protein
MAAHNHIPNPFGALQSPGGCPRCDERRQELNTAGRTQHNHGPQFGRRQPYGQCPRCDELHDGDEARPGNPAAARRAAAEAMRSRDITEHFAPGGPHARGACAPVCTAFDW